MTRTRVMRLAVLALWLAASGCMTLREVPRDDLARVPERRSVRVVTREGLVYDFDYASFASDTLTGYRSRPDSEGQVETLVTVRIAFDDVERVTTHELDWRRTGIVGGGVVLTALTVGLAKAHTPPESGGSSGGTKGITP